MKVRIYSSELAHGLFVVVPVSTDIESLPDKVRRLLDADSRLKEFELSADKPTIGLDVRAALGDIETKGFHVTKPEFLPGE